MHGMGTYTYKKTDDIYSGNFKEGLKDGKGVYEFKDESRLDGLWEKGHFKEGHWQFKNAGSYQGSFDNGQPKGPGCFRFVNGVTQQGDYKGPEPSEDDEEPPLRLWHGQSVYAN